MTVALGARPDPRSRPDPRTAPDPVAALAADVEAVAAGLTELDGHPGLAVLDRLTPAGLTAARAAVAAAAHQRLWTDLGRYRAVLDAARAADGAELAELLDGESVELDRREVPWEERTLGGPAEVVERTSPAALRARMSADFAVVGACAAAVAAAHDRTTAAVDALAAELARAATGTDLSGTDPATTDPAATDPGAAPLLTDLAARLVALRAATAHDPLGAQEGPLAAGLAELADDVAAATARRVAADRARAGWDGQLAALRARVDAVAAARTAAAEQVAAARALVRTAEPPGAADPVPGLAAALAALAGPGTWGERAAGAAELERACAAALAEQQERARLGAGLVERHGELAGRLSAYRAKAARLGVVEDAGLRERDRRAAAVLADRPVDLAAATVAVAEHQRRLRELAQERGDRT